MVPYLCIDKSTSIMTRTAFQTEHIALDPHRCEACWACVEACPKGVLGKVNILFHKHAVVRGADECIGCGKCVKVCKSDAITKI